MTLKANKGILGPLSLFSSFVQFLSNSSTTIGKCFTSSEYTSKSGTAEGNWTAAGFGFCCKLTDIQLQNLLVNFKLYNRGIFMKDDIWP